MLLMNVNLRASEFLKVSTPLINFVLLLYGFKDATTQNIGCDLIILVSTFDI